MNPSPWDAVLSKSPPEGGLPKKCFPFTSCRGVIYPVSACPRPRLAFCHQRPFPVHPNYSTKGGCFVSPRRAVHSCTRCSFAPPHGRFRIAIRLYTLFCGRCTPMYRIKPHRGERVGAEIETPVGKAANTPWHPRCSWRALLAIPASNIALAQSPPDELTLVNADRDFVERKGGGEFVARPVFDRQIESLFYAVRDADTGDWISAMYRVRGGEKERSDGWSTPGSTPTWTSTPSSTGTGPTCWSCWRSPWTGEGRLLRRHTLPRAGPHLGQDPLRPQPGRWARAFAGW